MMSSDETLQAGRERLLQIYRYLEALNSHRNPVKYSVEEHVWMFWFDDIPEHHAIVRGEIDFDSCGKEEETGTGKDDFILKVGRPRLSEPPSPPDLILEWLESGWSNPESKLVVRESIARTDEKGNVRMERFSDQAMRIQALNDWRLKRDEWAKREIPARKAMRIFERFYELYARIQKESERVELVLGDGILRWPREEGLVHYPVLLTRVQLEFNPGVPEFVVSESDLEVELHSALFRSMPDVDGQVIAQCREELRQGGYHPLGGEDTSEFLKRFIVQLSPRGEFIEKNAVVKSIENPQICRSPVIFVRDRTQGYGAALEAILEDLKTREDIPKPLLNICGLELPPSGAEEAFDPADAVAEPEDILLGKPANPEQIAIAKSIKRHDGVLVQGPPGTGKTHTIANLIGNFLAEGKSVLVTSHTTKALRVLREQVVEEIRPLCVSVLESDSTSRRQLESSIEGIVQRLSSSDIMALEKESAKLAAERKSLIEQLKKLRSELVEARAGEYREVVIEGESYSPSEAARKIARERETNGWIPGPLRPGAHLPLSESELACLYRTNESIAAEDETELTGILPEPSELPEPRVFRRLLETLNGYSEKAAKYREDLWEEGIPEYSPAELETLLNKVISSVEGISPEVPWKFAAVYAGYKGAAHCKPWECLLNMIEELHEESAKFKEDYLQFQPYIDPGVPPEKQWETVNHILKYLEKGGSLSKLTLITHPGWKKFIEQSKIKGDPPSTIQHFQVLRAWIHLVKERKELKARWNLQLAPLGACSSGDLGEEPEEIAFQFCGAIRNCLNWYSTVWSEFERAFERFGLRWKVLLEESPQNLNPFGEILRLKETVTGPLRQVIETRINHLYHKKSAAVLEKLETALVLLGGNCPRVVNDLAAAVREKNAEAYQDAFQRLVDLVNRRSELKLREELLSRLEKDAPAWAKKIRMREGIHKNGKMPGEARPAWLWRQIYEELERRWQLSLVDLQARIENLANNIRETTNRLIETRAWAAQLARTGINERQALVGYLDLMKKIGSGTGKRVPRLRIEARRKMSECRTAVPVWIMPLSRVAENFDPKSTRFDVVIIDEASQCDVMGLIALYMAKKVIIVGDHEQVSPLAIGQKLDQVQHLIDEYLSGIPNHMLYDGQMSVYDLARASFGGTICLVEHFRSVPDIIGFSNHLSYDGRIKPLRDDSSVNLKPALVPCRVSGSVAKDRTNKEEAETIALLLLSALEQPEYRDKTFGVISLIGEEQAMEIERLLRKYISAEEYLRRNIICGNAAHFQGDERDVMFLSMVYGPASDPPLKMLDAGFLGMYKKRYNVAASRAREQMWVVYSLDPRVDLKPGDLRRLLIEHVENPCAFSGKLEEKGKRTPSLFEKEVLKYLTQAGYNVTPQWEIGTYTIDLVVEGANGKRLAVECDGDRHYPADRISEDIARQSLLERLGWTFIRIRGSQFFQKPDETMGPVFQRLQELGIEPSGKTEKDDRPPEMELINRVYKRAAELKEELGKHGANDFIHFPGINGLYKKPAEENMPVIHRDYTNKETGAKVEPETKQTGDPVHPVHRVHPAESGTKQKRDLKEENNRFKKDNPAGEIDRYKLEPAAAAEPFDIVEYFRNKNIEIIDKRRTGGLLWIIGGKEIAPVLEELKAKGYRFMFFETGVISTDNRPAWCLTEFQ